MATATGGKPGKHRESAFPARGTGDGWRDVWDDPATHTAYLRRLAAAVQQHEAAALAQARTAFRILDGEAGEAVDLAAQARRLRAVGWSRHAIARELGISVRAVDRATGDADALRPGAVRVWHARDIST